MKYYYKPSFIALVCKCIATLGPIGYLPAPGTMGTLCAFPVVIGFRWLALRLPSFIDQGILLALCIGLSVWIVSVALPLFHESDPSEIVLDEVAGFVFTLYLFPLTPQIVCMAFVLFRFFDIVKPLGITCIESISGVWGIMLDDLAAALMARIVLSIILKIMGFA